MALIRSRPSSRLKSSLSFLTSQQCGVFSLGIQTEHLVRIREVYCEELGSVRKISKKERVEFTRRANSEFRYLRGIIYSQQVRSKSAIDENRAAHILKTDRLTNDVSKRLLNTPKLPRSLGKVV